MSDNIHSMARKASRAVARKNRSQVRIPARKPDQWIQVTVQARNVDGTYAVSRAGSTTTFDAKLGGHYTFSTPAIGSSAWVVMIGGTSPLIMSS